MTDDPPKKEDPAPETTTQPQFPQQPTLPAKSRPANAPHFIDAPATGEVPDIVKAQLAQTPSKLIVYVGATWCEPCQRFHEAVNSGALDADLAGFTFLAFDMDRDRERLHPAGYQSKYIPLFVIPGADGRGGPGKQIEGSITGPG
ncbi:MAG: thioredoxin family protein, partial [Polyangiaceae bacterium]